LSRTTFPGNEASASAPISPSPQEVRLQLDAILGSPLFHGSKRSQKFLAYVCEKSLSGDEATLKERTIAIEVFGRRPQSELGDDTIVRVGAREVRKRLAQYYVSTEGTLSDIRIDLPTGCYAPEFRYASLSPEKLALAASSPVETVAARPPARRFVLNAGIVLLAILAIAVSTKSLWSGGAHDTDAFTRFWEPVFRSHEPLLLAVAHPIVYKASRRAMLISEQGRGRLAMPLQRPIQVPPHELDGSDIIPVFNQFVGFGDMVVATDVSAMLARKSKAVRVRMASGVEFADLRQAPALLVGAITNRWTMELQQSWRFQFERTTELNYVIVDTAQAGRQWSIPHEHDASIPEDYVMICRIANSFTGELLLVGAGIRQNGTEAAGPLLTDIERLTPLLRGLPAGWESKNVQLVLHTKVIGNSPAKPELVAWHVW